MDRFDGEPQPTANLILFDILGVVGFYLHHSTFSFCCLQRLRVNETDRHFSIIIHQPVYDRICIPRWMALQQYKLFCLGIPTAVDDLVPSTRLQLLIEAPSAMPFINHGDESTLERTQAIRKTELFCLLLIRIVVAASCCQSTTTTRCCERWRRRWFSLFPLILLILFYKASKCLLVMLNSSSSLSSAAGATSFPGSSREMTGCCVNSFRTFSHVHHIWIIIVGPEDDTPKKLLFEHSRPMAWAAKLAGSSCSINNRSSNDVAGNFLLWKHHQQRRLYRHQNQRNNGK